MEILTWLAPEHATFWALIGVGFLIVEILFPAGFFLSFALAGFATALAVGLGAVTGTIAALLTFALIGAASILPLRALLARLRPQVKDINDY